ncbi:hypothetical protein Tco_1124982 [Tanacetum coccineum]|uniref:Uncharacterized protein n=1 Tax=Tanacetum coccineum TaxID=301880 RepID=A0ABQ5JAI3_9ASTR
MLPIHAEEGEDSGKPFESQPTPSPAQSFHEEKLSDIPSSSQPQKTQKHRKGRKLSNRVLDLEKAMTAQAKEIAILKKRVKKLEKRKRSRTQGLKLFKIGTSKRRSLDKEDASKHGRTLSARLISEEDDFDAGFDVVRDEGITHVEGDAEQVVIAAAEVVNAGVSVSTAEPKTPPTTTTTTLLEDDEVTVAATLVQMSETSKAKSILDDERAGLEQAMRLQAEQEAEHVEQIHLDYLLAQRMQEEQEMIKQQKKRQVEVLESAKYYTEEDWDIIRANIELNAELSKILLEENEPGEYFATRMVNLLNQRKKFFAEQRAQARRNKPMTETHQRTYMSTYLKHQGSQTFAQLKKLSDEEIKAKYERLVRSIANFIPIGAEERVKRPGPELQSDTSKKQKTTEVKEVPVTDEPVKEPTAPKQEKIEQPIKKSGRQKSMARKRKLGQSTAKEDEEYEKEKEELSLFLIIAFDKHKEVDYEILDQRSPIFAWNSEYYGPKPLHDEVCDNHDLSRLVKPLVLTYVPIAIFGIIREVFVKLLLDSFGKLSIRLNMPTQTIPMLSKKPKSATVDLHKDLLGTRNPGLGYMAKRAQPVLYDADTLLHPAHHPVRIWDRRMSWTPKWVSMTKMSKKTRHVRPHECFYEKGLNALCSFLRRTYLEIRRIGFLFIPTKFCYQASKSATPGLLLCS